jgi:hypothetical protein
LPTHYKSSELRAFAAYSRKRGANGVICSVLSSASHRSPTVPDCVPIVALFQVASLDSPGHSADCDSGHSDQAEKAARKPTKKRGPLPNLDNETAATPPQPIGLVLAENRAIFLGLAIHRPVSRLLARESDG